MITDDARSITDDAGSEELLLSMGALVATAVLLLVAFSLFRTTLPADRSVILQSAASEVSGDIATVASASVPYSRAERYPYSGIALTVSSDYVTALDSAGASFARPLPVRVNPGCYSGSDASWNNTAEFRSCLNAMFGADGSEASPIASSNASGITGLLASARLYMAATPLVVDPCRPLIIEKLLIYLKNGTSGEMECVPCVFVYQR